MGRLIFNQGICKLKIKILLTSFLLINSAFQCAYSLGAPPNRIEFTPTQIVKRFNFELAHPALHSTFLKKGSIVPRVAYVGHCESSEGDRHGKHGAAQSAMYTCPLVGLSPGVAGDLMIRINAGTVDLVFLSIESRDESSAGLAALSYILSSECLIVAVDRDSLKSSIASEDNLHRISRDLSPSLSKQQTDQKVSADGLVFARHLIAGDQTLTIAPAP